MSFGDSLFLGLTLSCEVDPGSAHPCPLNCGSQVHPAHLSQKPAVLAALRNLARKASPRLEGLGQMTPVIFKQKNHHTLKVH